MSKAAYTIAGFSTHPSKGRKFRCSNREVYPEILVKEGHLDVEMYDLPEPMNRVDAKAYIESIIGEPAATPAEITAEATAEVVTGDVLDEALIAAMAAYAEAEANAEAEEPEEEPEIVAEGTDEVSDFQEEEMAE
jgi:hypothetical protein